MLMEPAREMLDTTLEDCRPHALALGCAGALDRVRQLAAENGADRQRTFAARNGGPERLGESLAERFQTPALQLVPHGDSVRQAVG